ncbi:DUF6069 family protein [Actinoplanes subglobosus]|uniref:DUF6069 family protein n=1 Tax=Actinoplanes subglobosus TaxID=1547892 RepID=A0ABV8J1E6_9ACTN
MPTLTLRGGERVTVVAAQWRDAFAVVTCGRVQLELRDGAPGPVLGRDAGFWLRGTGVRALHNPGRRTARIRIATPRPERYAMSSTTSLTPSRHSHRFRRLAVTGLLATLAAVVATTVAAAIARAAGVEFTIPDGGETIPLAGFAVVTGFFCLVGVAIAAALLRWTARPEQRFVWTAVTLTVVSLVPPLISGAAATTAATLLLLHLIPAAVMIPTLARALRTS